MERLTEKTKDCFGYRLKDGSDAEVGFFKDYDAFFSHNMVVKALGEYEDLEEQGLFLRLPCKVGEAVDKLFSHNEVVALWYDKPSDKNHSYLLWRGMAHQIPKEYKENRILKFKGIIPERFSESDTINLLITPYVIPCEEAEAKLREMEEK